MAELFENFEVNAEPRWPMLVRLVGLSIAVHFTVLVGLIYVPAVSDVFGIAGMLADTNYVDKGYSRTHIGEDVELVSIGERFHYPEGYFSIASESGPPIGNGYGGVHIVSQAERVKPNAEVSPTPTPEVTPTPEPSPSPSPGVSPDTNAPAVAESSVGDPKTVAQAEKQLDQIAAENQVLRPNENEINTRPLKDWLARANELRVKGELDLNSKVEITIVAQLNSGCKLSDAVVIQKSGDARLAQVARDMVSAIGDSGMLSFLRDPKKVNDAKGIHCDEIPLQLTVKLDQTEIGAKVQSQADTPERAAEMARGYNGLLTLGQLAKQGRDEEVLYKSTKVTSEGKQIVVNFNMPRTQASELLKKRLPTS